MWAKLDSIGVSGKLFNAVKSLYASVASCVRINNLTTDWFDVSLDLRQGCCLSPLLLNLFINDVAVRIKALGKGVMIDEDLVCLLMYADNIVFISEMNGAVQMQCLLMLQKEMSFTLDQTQSPKQATALLAVSIVWLSLTDTFI